MLAAMLMLIAGLGAAASAHALAPLPACGDNLDSEPVPDGNIDWPKDPGCSSPADTAETGPTGQDPVTPCSNAHIDGNPQTDFPNDPGCESAADTTDAPNPSTQCSRGGDNDNDGRTNFPADPGCIAASDNSEADTECSDRMDNDGDRRVDFPLDWGCAVPTPAGTGPNQADNDESDPPQCNDGRDNDGDRAIDFPADPGCTSAADGEETDTQIAYVLPANDQLPSPLLQSPLLLRTPLLSPFPIVRLRGRTDRKGVRVTLLTVRAPAKSKISVYCRGASCPRRRLAITAGKKLVRVKQFERRLRGGTELKIYVTKPGFVGKYTRFRFKNRRVPLRTDRCVMTPGTKPRSCPES